MSEHSAEKDAGQAQQTQQGAGDVASLVVRELRAEVEHWKAHAWEAGQGFARVCRDYAASAARVTEIRRQVLALHVSDRARSPFCEECGHAWPCSTARVFPPVEAGEPS